jgi:hypothetical protein
MGQMTTTSRLKLADQARDFSLGFDLLTEWELSGESAERDSKIYPAEDNTFWHKDFGIYYKDKNGDPCRGERVLGEPDEMAVADDLDRVRLGNAPLATDRLLYVGDHSAWHYVYSDWEDIFEDLNESEIAMMLRDRGYLKAFKRSRSVTTLSPKLPSILRPWIYISYDKLLELALLRIACGAIAVYHDAEWFQDIAEEEGLLKSEPPNAAVQKAAKRLRSEIKKQGLIINSMISDLNKLADGIDLGEKPIMKQSTSKLDSVVREINALAEILTVTTNKKQNWFPANAIFSLLVDVLGYPCPNEDKADNLRKSIMRSQERNDREGLYPVSRALIDHGYE